MAPHTPHRHASRLDALRQRLARLTFGPPTFPLAVAALFALCFGAFLPQQGFFWDDWTQLLSRRLYGYGAYLPYFYERPFSGWTHMLFGPLMGDFPLRWQIFTLTLRAGSVVAAWWLFRLAWPQRTRDAALAALLFAVYPGFTQQPIAVAYHQHWLQYLLFLLSLAFMLQAVRRPQQHTAWTALALACQLLQFSITEFLVGVELLRPALLYVAMSGSPGAGARRRITAAGRAWAPYLLALAAFVVWRTFFLQLPEGARNTPVLLPELRSAPAAALVKVASFAVTDALNVLVAAWGKVFDLRLADSRQPVILFSWALSALAALGLGLYLARLRPANAEEQPPAGKSQLEWVGIGLLGALLGPLPLWASGENILLAIENDAYHADRFTLAAMLWAGLLLVGVLSWAVERWKARAFLFAALVGLLVGFQARNANDYRWLSVEQARFYWQLAWRAPSIQPGTALIAEEILFPYQGLFSTSSAVNLLYAQEPGADRVAYWVYALRPRFIHTDPLAEPVSFDTRVRLFHFQGHTPNSLLLWYEAPKANCLWLLRPADADLPGLSPLTQRWLPVSKLERIGPPGSAAGPPSTRLFGPEPEHGWCYYFETADLARQYNDWATAARLGDEAQARGYSPERPGSNSAFEWQPFIEAYAHTGRWQEAAGLVLSSAAYDSADEAFLCARWLALTAGLPDSPARAEAHRRLSEALSCTP